MNITERVGDKCTGCFACYNACPVQCISQKIGEDGFLYPDIDSTKCIDCSKCIKVCPEINESDQLNASRAFYGWNCDEATRRQSSSGGIFVSLAKHVLQDGGVVYGAAFRYEDDRVSVECMSTAETSIENLLRSKYAQCNVKDAYKRILADLRRNVRVLYVSTPCQVAGLRRFLGRHYDNLITCDFVCHGVPSVDLFNKHLSYLGISSVKEINFRPKIFSWVDYIVVNYKRTKIYKKFWRYDEYFYAFEKHLNLRKSCYSCLYCNGNRSADITLADFWGIYKYDAKAYDSRGISLIMANSPKGESVIEKCRLTGNLCLHDLPLSDASYVYERKRNGENNYKIEIRNQYLQDVYTKGYAIANSIHKLSTSTFDYLIFRVKRILFQLKNYFRKS